MSYFLKSFAPARAVRARILTATPAILLLVAILLLLPAMQAVAHEFTAGPLRIDHPWSRATPAGARNAAGYAAITNSGAEPDRLISASAEIAGRTEIHEMAMNDGIMTMRRLPDGVPVPAGGTVELKPASYHLMFLDLKRPVTKDERFAGTLVFEKAGSVAVEFAVHAMGSGGHDHH